MSDTTTKTGCSEAVLRELVHAGILAPSGDNTQPWKFEIDPAESRIMVSVDPTRDRSPMNAGQRMARIAVGAAVENIIQTAIANGLPPVVSYHGDSIDLSIRVSSAVIPTQIIVPDNVLNRCTNRKLYDKRKISAETLEQVSKAEDGLDEPKICWITDEKQVRNVANVIRKADAILFGNHTMRRAFLGNIRFDRPPDEKVEEGLSLGSLEATPVDRIALRCVQYLPNWLASVLRLGNQFASKTHQLALSSSGYLLLWVNQRSQSTDFLTGRILERIWLELTKQKIASQPMMSIMGILDCAEYESFDLNLAYSLLNELRCSLPILSSNGIPTALMRFGYAQRPSAYSGRRK